MRKFIELHLVANPAFTRRTLLFLSGYGSLVISNNYALFSSCLTPRTFSTLHQQNSERSTTIDNITQTWYSTVWSLAIISQFIFLTFGIRWAGSSLEASVAPMGGLSLSKAVKGTYRVAFEDQRGSTVVGWNRDTPATVPWVVWSRRWWGTGGSRCKGVPSNRMQWR